MFRRLTQFYEVINGLTQDYLRSPIPSLHGHLFGLHLTNVLDIIYCRTDRYENSFFPDSVAMWNDLGPELRGAESLSIFKKNILKIYRPTSKSLFHIHDPSSVKWIFQLRVGLSPLKAHKKNHNFEDDLDDICICSLDAETSSHFFYIALFLILKDAYSIGS